MTAGRRLTIHILTLLLLLPGAALALPFSNLVIFGDSLADTGNNAFLVDNGAFLPDFAPGARTATPIPNSAFIPTVPYATNRYSNGPVWTEQFASDLGLSAIASTSGGTNFAFGGALTGPPTPTPATPTLLQQVGMFLGATGGVAPPGALYVVEGGGNDARAALATALGGGNPGPQIAAYANNMFSILTDLEQAGARDILLANVPDISLTPAVQILQALNPGAPIVSTANGIASQMNLALLATLGTLPPTPGVDIHFLDLFDLLDQVVGNPAQFGMTNVLTACAADPSCISDPTGTFFWDGIHPTTAGATLIADAALKAIPEPSLFALLVAVALAWSAAARTKRRALV
jgi:outer membrane lipase/esterase